LSERDRDDAERAEPPHGPMRDQLDGIDGCEKFPVRGNDAPDAIRNHTLREADAARTFWSFHDDNGNWHSGGAAVKLRGMTVSRLRVAKSETRDLAERDRVALLRNLNQPSDWQMSNKSFFTAFVVIAAILAAIALVLR
jgi:hypothetical protein